MYLSCLPVSFFTDIIDGRMSIAEWAQMAAEIGLDGVDLSILFVPDHKDETIHSLRREIEQAGMRVAMVTTYPDFTHPDPAQRERELAKAEETVSVAANLGAELVRVTAGQAHPDVSRDRGIGWAVEGLTRLVEKTRNSGVTLVYENHSKPAAWTYTDFSEPPDRFLEIVNRTSGIGLGINFDTANAAAFAPDPLALLDRVADRVVSVHASDTAVKGALQPVLLGTGITPFHTLFAHLEEAGWDGWICIEEASFNGRQGIIRAVDFIQNAWPAR